MTIQDALNHPWIKVIAEFIRHAAGDKSVLTCYFTILRVLKLKAVFADMFFCHSGVVCGCSLDRRCNTSDASHLR